MSTRHSLLVALLTVGLALALTDLSGPGVGSWWGAVAMALVGALWLVSWLVRGVLWCVAHTQRRSERASGNGLLAEVALVLIAAGLLWLRIPLKMRFALSESAMTRYAEDALRAKREAAKVAIDYPRGYRPSPPVYPKRLGLFPVREVWSGSAGEVIVAVEKDSLGLDGFVYVPDDQPSHTNLNVPLREPMGGRWFRFRLGEDW